MSKIIEIAISKNSGSEMKSVESAETVPGKGLLYDRHFKDNNDKKSQITLIEVENIKHFNKASNTFIPSINFRRNLVTEGIRLNQLVGSEFLIGDVKVKAHDLCRPCKYLQNLLKQKNFVKDFLLKGGLRCEILIGGRIFVGDNIQC